jgi:hypothetical protein
MLVLALEFSRGCTAHAGVGNHAAPAEQLRSGDNHPTGARTGCVVTAGTRRRGLESRKDARARGAPEGLDLARALTRPRGSHEHQRDVTGIDPKGRSLKTEE